MKRRYILPSIVLIACPGCGAIARRTGMADMDSDTLIPRYYPAINVDGRLITDSPPASSAGGRTAMFVGGIIDLPISLVTDTLLLPYDIFKAPR